MTEAEREAHIRDCGKQIQKACANGSRPEAVKWQDAMYAAIRSRTPEHKARLEADIMERIENPENCYFVEAGNLARFQRTGLTP